LLADFDHDAVLIREGGGPDVFFLISLVFLAVGYAVYGRIAEKAFNPDDRPTPAIAMEDKVDYSGLSLFCSIIF